MSHQLELVTVQCPYCWEMIEILVDGSVEHQSYIEDCQVCCNPIQFIVNTAENSPPSVQANHQDD